MGIWGYKLAGKLSIFGRSALLVAAELVANAVCWVIAGLLFARNQDTRSIMNLALLAWVCVSFLAAVIASNAPPTDARPPTRCVLFPGLQVQPMTQSASPGCGPYQVALCM